MLNFYRLGGDHRMLSGCPMHWNVSLGRNPHWCVYVRACPFLSLTSASGLTRQPAGRINEAPSYGLSASLQAAGFRLGRLQTGTPARLDKSTIDFKCVERTGGDKLPKAFSFLGDGIVRCKVNLTVPVKRFTSLKNASILGQSSPMLENVNQ
jgi:tRNA U34 5-carboxymethylaminomethyl modifying enzyme MnmG/GidA